MVHSTNFKLIRRDTDETVEEDEAGHKHGETRNNRSHRGHFNLRGATLLDNGVKLVGGQGQNAVISASFDEVVHQQKGATTAVSSTQPIVAAPTAAGELFVSNFFPFLDLWLKYAEIRNG